MLLEIKNLHCYYGRIHALHGISIEINKGETVALIGSNGAGKSTTINCINGIVKSTSGSILFEGKELLGMSSHKICEVGIATSPEGREVFPDLTVRENLFLGAYNVKNKNEIKQECEKIFNLFPILKTRIHQQAGTLSGGEQQMLAIGRALMPNPKLLLLDEPSLGLAPNLVRFVFDIIKQINSTGTTVLLVEQNANMALKISNRAYVLETGKIKLSGEGKELLKNDEVRRAYLG